MSLVKKVVARLPSPFQFELESRLRARQVRKGTFSPGEPEFELLPSMVGPGDWVMDVGANIGHYTLELSRLVGPTGRVIAVEPMSQPFAQLAGLVARLRLQNVTLLNAAASDTGGIAEMEIPLSRDGLPSYYDAKIQPGGGERVLTFRIDDLPLAGPMTLVKVDVEGHEAAVLRGMTDLILRDQPVLVIEDSSPEVDQILTPLGYTWEKLAGSPNRVFRSDPTAIGR